MVGWMDRMVDRKERKGPMDGWMDRKEERKRTNDSTKPLFKFMINITNDN